MSLIFRSRATSSTVLPLALTSSTACSRNSTGYLLGRPISPFFGRYAKIRVSTEAGQSKAVIVPLARRAPDALVLPSVVAELLGVVMPAAIMLY